ncbi:MAG: hypothetical protein GY744_05385 [Gammaproteobacteria bacterium]|nr:hypothetical protein [Gammaproteobacteria bacterium]
MKNLYFTKEPEQVNPDKITITVQWETNDEVATAIFWGNTPDSEQGYLQLAGNTFEHEFQFTNLLPSNIYYISPFSVSDDNTTHSYTGPFATVSNSSGQVRHYFNHDVDYAVAEEDMAVWTPNITATVIHYFNMAQHTLCITMYDQELDKIV